MKPATGSPAAGELARSRRASKLRRGTLRGRARSVLRWLLLNLIRPFINLRIVGLEFMPRSGSFLVVANHLHNADPILLEMALTRSVHMMAKQELFRNRVLAWLVRRTGAFPVDRGRADRSAIRHAVTLLANGIPVGMFPEGTRSKTGVMQAAYAGAGLIALQCGATILPAAIFGTEHLPFNGERPSQHPARRRPCWRRPRITIRFGEPFTLPSERDGKRLTAAQATAMMMAEIAKLLPVAYRGVYGADAAGLDAAAAIELARPD